MDMQNKYGRMATGLSSLALAAMVFLAAGCSATKGQATSPAPGVAGAAGAANAPETAGVPKGADLWAQNCVRCHNSRSPNTYDDAQWEVITMHMRVRANLTAPDTREILAFLKSAH
jgi:cytochrome c5